MKLVNIGFGNLINSDKIVAVLSPDSAPAKRLVGDAKKDKRLIDATQGRKTESVIITDSDHIVLSYINNDEILQRHNEAEE
ncbi:MAG: DUF370 domain-containing protein [Clostridia bacterium]|nr:DUF370 domain-containing protein [Clostridia bacterium]